MATVHVATLATIPRNAILPQWQQHLPLRYHRSSSLPQPVTAVGQQRTQQIHTAFRTMGSMEIHQLVSFRMFALFQGTATCWENLLFRPVSGLFQQRPVVHANPPGILVYGILIIFIIISVTFQECSAGSQSVETFASRVCRERYPSAPTNYHHLGIQIEPTPGLVHYQSIPSKNNWLIDRAKFNNLPFFVCFVCFFLLLIDRSDDGCVAHCRSPAAGDLSAVQGESGWFPSGTPCNHRSSSYCLSGRCIVRHYLILK